MRFNLWRREGEEGLEERDLVDFLSVRAPLLGGLLGGDSGISASTTSAAPDGGLLGGVLGGGKDNTAAPPAATDSPASTNSPSAATTAAPGLLGDVGGAADGLLSPVLGASSSGGPLLGVGIGPSSAPLLSVAVGASSGPLINAGIGATSSPLLSIGVGAAPSAAPVSVAPSATSAPIQTSAPPSSTAASSSAPKASKSAGVVASSTKATSTPAAASSAQSVVATKASASIAQERPTDPTTLLTSVTAAPDSAASTSASGSVIAQSAASGLGTNGTQQTSAGHSNIMPIIIGVASGVGALVLLIALVIIMRRVFRKRRLGKAEYPPTSPLLPPMEDSFLPPSMARTISQRSKAPSNNGVGHNRMDSSSTVRSNLAPLDLQNEKAGFDREYRGILSPLPPAAKGTGQGVWLPQGQNSQRRVEPERDMSGRLKEFGLP